MKKLLSLIIAGIFLGSTCFAASETHLSSGSTATYISTSPGFHFSSKSTSTTKSTPQGIKTKLATVRNVNGVSIHEPGRLEVRGTSIFVDGKRINPKTGKFFKK